MDHSIIVPVGDAAAVADGILQSLEPIYKNGAAAYRPKTWTDTATKLVGILSGEGAENLASHATESEFVTAEQETQS